MSKLHQPLTLMTTDPIIERFLEKCVVERAMSIHTLHAYRRDLERFYQFFAQTGSKAGPSAWPRCQAEDCQAHLRQLSQRGLATSSILRARSALRQFFTFALEEGLVDEDPTRLLDRPVATQNLPEVIPQEAVETLLATAQSQPSPEGVRLLAIVELLYATGLRVSELVTLPLAELHLGSPSGDPVASPGGGQVRVRGKGNRERIVPLHALAQQALQAYLDVRETFLAPHEKSSPWLLPSRRGGHLTRQRCGQLLKELALRANVDPHSVFPHAFRHACATHLLENGADLLSVQKLLGHCSVATTQIYTHVQYQRLNEVVLQHHPLSTRKPKAS